MSHPSMSSPKAGRILQIVLNLLFAIPAIGIGAMTLVSPDVPAEALAENAIVGIVMLATAAVLVFDIFKPVTGGIMLLIWSLAFAITFNGFHISEYVLTARDVGYQTSWSVMTLILVVLGLFSLVRGGFGRKESEHNLT